MHDRHGAVRLDNFTLEIRPGEIVGLAGVEGNGQSELGMVLAGLLRPTEGHFYIGGTDLTHAGAAAVTAAGGGIVPEDRHAVACVTAMSVAENMFLNKLDRFTRFGLLQRGALNAAAQKQMRDFDVRAAGPEVAFSGSERRQPAEGGAGARADARSAGGAGRGPADARASMSAPSRRSIARSAPRRAAVSACC